eukprot:TRINITY_DN1183_c0_g1_i1.p1 TRINITY_DN1183_c0_g1~~TRINITY_DN1183_c0_g1_i1.p1  ORF type:complete len:126 (-),score=21.64 TRINITY_DN1183_c0_g1_i1:108-485(-)
MSTNTTQTQASQQETQKAKVEEKKEAKDQNTNQVWVSTLKRTQFFGNLALKMMKQHETVELHGLGNAISSTCEVSQYLVRQGKATVSHVKTGFLQSNQIRKPEIVIILKRTQLALQDTEDEGEDE